MNKASRFTHPLMLASAFLALFVPRVCAQQEIGFIEDFALAADRKEALRQLIPGTEDYYYYHAEACARDFLSYALGAPPHPLPGLIAGSSPPVAHVAGFDWVAGTQAALGLCPSPLPWSMSAPSVARTAAASPPPPRSGSAPPLFADIGGSVDAGRLAALSQCYSV